jgi:hypothetical protein
MAAMSKPTMRRTIQLLAMLGAAALSLSLNAMGASRPVSDTRATPELAQSYVWHDGDREQKVWLNPQVVAEFNPGKRSEAAASSVNAKARVLPMARRQAGVRLWQTDNAGDIAVRGLKAVNPSGKYSPVFHDSPSSASSMRALPGNIIITLDPAWDAAAVSAWLKRRNMEVVKKLEIGPNIYVIKTGPGLEALETANTLYQSGEVKAAFPDWWQEVQAK